MRWHQRFGLLVFLMGLAGASARYPKATPDWPVFAVFLIGAAMFLFEGWPQKAVTATSAELRFYVVEKPSAESILADVYFETTVPGLVLRAMGGLRAEDILLATLDEAQAKAFATAALAKIRSPA